MKKAKIILRFLLPPYQYTPETIHPTVRPLRDPATGFEANPTLDRLGFFTTRANMSSISKLFHPGSHLTGIISLIQTHALRFLLRRFRARHRDTLKRSLDHFAVMSICPGYRQADRYTVGFGQQTSFNALFGSIRRIWAGFFPRQAGPCSSRRPLTAKTSQSLSTRHSLEEPSPRAFEKLRLRSTLETASGLYCWNKSPFRSERSTDSRFAVQRIFHSWHCDPPPSACHHRNDACLDALAAVVRSFAIIRPRSCICFLFFVFSSLNPFKGTVTFEYIGNSGVIRIGSYYSTSISVRSSNLSIRACQAESQCVQYFSIRYLLSFP
jgi:hypothetical protein